MIRSFCCCCCRCKMPTAASTFESIKIERERETREWEEEEEANKFIHDHARQFKPVLKCVLYGPLGPALNNRHQLSASMYWWHFVFELLSHTNDSVWIHSCSCNRRHWELGSVSVSLFSSSFFNFGGSAVHRIAITVFLFHKKYNTALYVANVTNDEKNKLPVGCALNSYFL